MAKAKRASVRARQRARAAQPLPADAGAPAPSHQRGDPVPGTPSMFRFTPTPAALADCRRRFEETPEAIMAIARDYGVGESTLRRLAQREGWVRFRAPPVDLVPAAQLEAQAAALPPAGEGEALLDIAAAAARLFKLVQAEIEAAETVRAQLARRPQQTLDAQRTASTLRNLYATLRSLEPRQAGLAHTGQDHDDIPRDLDALRDALAQRIDALFAEPEDARTDRPTDDTGAAPA
jgi:hypothetical protein